MRSISTFATASGLAALLLGGCATAYHWGATDDPEWTPRVGTATFTQVAQALGQPMEKLPLPSGDLKARWYGKPITVSAASGTMEDESVEHTETRAYWRDMRFDQNGLLIRAWMSDQRELQSSEGP